VRTKQKSQLLNFVFHDLHRREKYFISDAIQ